MKHSFNLVAIKKTRQAFIATVVVGGATTLQMVHMQHTVCAICIWYAFQVLVNHQMESMLSLIHI